MIRPDKQQVFSISNPQQFTDAALAVFRYQAANCAVYRDFMTNLGIDPSSIKYIEDIPFLPITFFKSHDITSAPGRPQITFTSSGTTGTINSNHFVTDVSWYEDSFRKAFGLFYGDIGRYCILALLPSYLEREGSSLIYMVRDWVKNSGDQDSGFYLYDHDDLYQQLKMQQTKKKPTLLLGVTFALLEFAERYQLDFPELIVMETGGMKGRRKEMIREALHGVLCDSFGVSSVHSEYGMTELLTQAYSAGEGLFRCAPWMRVIARDTNDPMSNLPAGRVGGINVIDLANTNSCSFIATQDLGKVYNDGSFEVLGRFDNSDIRGCNLLIA